MEKYLGTNANFSNFDRQEMATLLDLAAEAAKQGEVPIAAALWRGDELLCRSYNLREAKPNPLGHAELLCLQEGARRLSTRHLSETTLYCTLEPCMMCLGAILEARIGRLVYSASSEKTGAIHLLNTELARHQPVVDAGLLAADSSRLLQEFFQNKREMRRQLGSQATRRKLYEAGYKKLIIDEQED
ncbi:MAG: nucleoside deaminase [Eubacteriales bacterium]|nr:nucleoside deaminase [Eubacteriales bacterium]